MSSKVIYSGNHYQACHMNDNSLIVTSKRVQKGVRIEHPESERWIDAINDRIDDSEGHDLCKVLMDCSALFNPM